ncbi:Transcriptional activator of proteases prtT [Frankliniella fusca]|uniref:Transcriptional activator of proteases prtT n=1 Tax=Frankliniella fusca TaxID=407009 RepID=A0AAE1GSM0_9NEOP|nr:Transcriptional activator of proteases prtT [Frankliniella fusca]
MFFSEPSLRGSGEEDVKTPWSQACTDLCDLSGRASSGWALRVWSPGSKLSRSHRFCSEVSTLHSLQVH